MWKYLCYLFVESLFLVEKVLIPFILMFLDINVLLPQELHLPWTSHLFFISIKISLVLSHLFNVCVCCAQLYIKSTPTVNNVFMVLEIFHNRLSKQKNCSNLFQMKVIADNVEIFLRPQEKSHNEWWSFIGWASEAYNILLLRDNENKCSCVWPW